MISQPKHHIYFHFDTPLTYSFESANQMEVTTVKFFEIDNISKIVQKNTNGADQITHLVERCLPKIKKIVADKN